MRVKELLINGALSACICVATMWGLDRDPPVTQVSNSILKLEGHPKPGENGIIISDVIRHRSCRTTLERTYRDGGGTRYILPEIEFTPPVPLNPPFQDHFSSPLEIDRRSDTGPSMAQLDLFWKCNPIHYIWPIHVQMQLPFTIYP